MDVPIKFNFSDAASYKVNSPEVLKVFEKYGFKTLTKRVKKVGNQLKKQAQMRLV
jgi:hypothetical protein